MSAEEAQKRAERYLETAALLLGEGDYESCVSRAYYAMFYMVREMLRQRGIDPQTHSGTLNQFGLRIIKAGDLPARYGKMFGDAQEVRQFAEYADALVISEEEAAATLEDARAFVERARELLNGDR